MEPVPANPVATIPPPVGMPPPFAGEVVMKRQGGTAVKVWGILLLIGALFACMNLLGTVMMAFGDGIDISSMMIGTDSQTKADVKDFISSMIQEVRSGPTFWVSFGGQVITTLLAFVAAVQLLRSQPSGRVIAIVLGTMVLFSIPVTGHEMLRINDIMAPKHRQLMENMMTRKLDEVPVHIPPPGPGEPKMTPEEEEQARARIKAARKREIDQVMSQMSGFTKIANAIGVVFTVLFTLVIDFLLLYFMTRPKVKEYLANAAKYKDALPPGFHPSLGLPLYAPPNFAEATSGKPNTGAPPKAG